MRVQFAGSWHSYQEGHYLVNSYKVYKTGFAVELSCFATKTGEDLLRRFQIAKGQYYACGTLLAGF